MARMILSLIVPRLLTSSVEENAIRWQDPTRSPNNTYHQNRRTAVDFCGPRIYSSKPCSYHNNSTAILSWVYSLRRSVD
ncbi:hypothetical protein F5J12DRAFT_824803, partial [Pisolithus orientalis]|uniref:uncharacterized protein n=1 Tax=Pisolithus orientalis TaxID=936130 RepID=UPI002224D290